MVIVETCLTLTTEPLAGGHSRHPQVRRQQRHASSDEAAHQSATRAVMRQRANHVIKPAIVHQTPPVVVS
jgi:hypothetical protein